MNRIRQIFMVLMLMASLINYGCSAEEEGMNDDSQVEANSSNTVSFVMPDADEVSTYAEATSAERQIYGVVWLQFRGAIGTTAVAHGVMTTELATALMQNSTKYPMLTLPFKPEEGDRIVFLINAPQNDPSWGDITADGPGLTDLIATTDYAYVKRPSFDFNDITENNIDEYFKLNVGNLGYCNTTWTNAELPMYGKIDGWKSNGVNTCIVTRAVASVQVSIPQNQNQNISQTSYNSYLSSSLWYSINRCAIGNIEAPVNGVGLNAETGANGIAIGLNDLYSVYYKRVVNENTTSTLKKTAYLYEFPNSTRLADGATIDATKFNKDRQCVLFTWDGYWYRLDFYDQNTGKYIDIKRNTRYTFVIEQLQDDATATPVYTTAEEALANPPSNISYAVKSTSTTGENVVVSNGQYALALDYNALLVYGDNSTAQTYSIGNVKFIDNLESPVESTITNNHIGANTASGATTNITSLNTNGSDNPLSITMPAGVSDATIGIIVGGLQATIKVHREPELGGNEVAFMAHKTLHAEQIGSNPGIDGFSSVANPSASDLTTEFNANEISDCYVKLNANSSLSVRTSEVAMYGSPDYGGVSMKVILNQGTGIGEQPQLIVSPWELSQESIDAGSWIRSDETKYYVGIDQENKLHIDSEAKTISFTANSEVEIESITGGWLDEALVRSSFAAGLAADKKSGSFTAQYKDGTNFLDGSNNEIVSTVVLRAGTARLIVSIYPSELPIEVPDAYFLQYLKTIAPYSINEDNKIIPTKAREYFGGIGSDVETTDYDVGASLLRNVMSFQGIEQYVNIKYLRLDYPRSDAVLNIDCSRMSMLQSFQIYVYNWSSYPINGTITLPDNAPYLTTFIMTKEPTISGSFSNLPNLKTLQLGPASPLIANLDLSSHTKLNSLNLQGAASSLTLAANYPELTSLQLLDLNITLTSFSIFPAVEYLKLSNCPAITLCNPVSSVLKTLDVRSCAQLVSVDLSGCANIDSVYVTSCSSLASFDNLSCVALRGVNITNCVSLVESGVGSGSFYFNSTIENLTLYNVNISSALNWNNMTNLKLLNIGCTWLNNLDLSFFPLLQNFGIGKGYNSYGNLFDYVTSSPSVNTINFSNNNNLRYIGICDCPNLTTVNFDNSISNVEKMLLGYKCPLLTTAEIGSSFTSLNELSICYSSFETLGPIGLNIADGLNISNLYLSVLSENEPNYIYADGHYQNYGTYYYGCGLKGNVELPVLPKLTRLYAFSSNIESLDIRKIGTPDKFGNVSLLKCNLGLQNDGGEQKTLKLRINSNFNHSQISSSIYDNYYGWKYFLVQAINMRIMTYIDNDVNPTYTIYNANK